ncbi:hypothetical protein Unana1_01313 [Umbelopsis nana]
MTMLNIWLPKGNKIPLSEANIANVETGFHYPTQFSQESHPQTHHDTGDQYGFIAKDDEIISSVNDKLNFDGSDDVKFDTYKRSSTQ